VLCDLPHVQISQVLSLCYVIVSSLLLSQDSCLACLLLILRRTELLGNKHVQSLATTATPSYTSNQIPEPLTWIIVTITYFPTPAVLILQLLHTVASVFSET
jgi:hypothetical protein